MAQIDYFKNFKEKHPYIAGQTILDAGDRAEVLYAVREGEVGLLYQGRDLDVVYPGEVFGAVSLFGDGPNVLTAFARTDCQVTHVSRRMVTFLIHETPMFTTFLLRTMAHRIRLMDHLVSRQVL